MLDTAPHKFNIRISTEEYDGETESNGLACQLVFTYTEKYPDTEPLVEVENPVNFEDDYEEKLLEHVKETVRTKQKFQFFILHFKPLVYLIIAMHALTLNMFDLMICLLLF